MASANVVNTLIVPAASKVAPYYDDFDESKNFYRVLFRPGYAVQARELTQLQTILQNQIERFGRHVFVNGSSVIGGKLDISDITTLNVDIQYANSDVDIASFKDKTITYSSGNTDIQARVIQTSPSVNGSPACLHVKYITGSEFSNGATIITTTGGHYANLSSNANMSSNGSIAFIYDSIYFMQGFFIKVPKQSVVVSKHNRLANSKVGLEVVDDILTEYNDASLLDPAQESSNYQAPGATRYQVSLNLANRSLDSVDDEKWIEVARLNNGIITKLQSTPMYSEIEEVLARRTYDESGNYIVRPFKTRIDSGITDPANNFTLVVSPGKAYVYGFECENQAATLLNLPRARSTRSRSDYNIRVNYGNYVIVDHLQGTFDTAGQGIVDLHCVDTANVVTSSNAGYYSTKIGTARLRDLNFYGGSSNTTTRQYELYFYDNKFNVITDNAASTANSTSEIVLGTANSSLANDAYTGAYIKVTAGPASGDLRLITDYDGANKRANVALPFSATTTSASRYELRFDITDVDGFVQWTTFTGGASSNAAATIDMLNKDDGTLNGNTFISEATFGDSFYQLPSSYIAGVSNTSYIYRRVYNSVTFSSGNATITSASNEQFEGETTTSNTSSTIMDNFLVIVTNPTGSARTVGDQVKITATVNTTTPETSVLRTGNTSESFTATVYSKMYINNPSPRTKTLVSSNTFVFSSSSPSAQINGPTGSNTKVYLASAQVVIKNPSKSNESLYISDVQAVKKVYYSPSEPSVGQTLTGLEDVTNKFTVDRGHRAEWYDHASVKVKAGFNLPQGHYIVCCRYYSHSADSGFFAVNSYQNLNTIILEDNIPIDTGYANIPVVNGTRMSDIIDFRPSRPSASGTSNWNFSFARVPIATTNFNCDFSYYRERRDIVVMTVNDELKLIQGDSTGNFFPETPARSLLLHKIRVLPYTISRNDVFVESLDHRRYTMADIGAIDRRLKSMEYNVALNFLEKNAQGLVIKDVNGLDRSKYGILAEDFSSHLLGDTNNPDYSCAVDVNGTYSPTGGIMMPRVISNLVKLDANNESAVGLSVSDDKVMLAYKTTPAIVQDKATKSVPVADYLFGDFRGQIITTPEQDIWKDITTLPPEVASIPKPVMQFDITMTEITNITNNQTNTTNIKKEITNVHPSNTITIIERSDPPPPPPTTTTYDKLLLTFTNGFAKLGQLKWRYFGKDLHQTFGDPTRDYFITTVLTPHQIWETGEFYGDYGASDVDGSGRVNTTALNTLQLYALTRKGIDAVGFPIGSGALSVSDQRIEFIFDVYSAILNRPPDFPGLCFWCIKSAHFKWSEQQTREAMNTAAIQNNELGSGMDPNLTAVLTPIYIIGDDLNAALVGSQSVRGTGDVLNYETMKTPDGRTAVAARTPESMIRSFYETYLGRDAEEGGLGFWMGQYNDWVKQYGDTADGRAKAAQLLEAGFKNSPERQTIGGDNFKSEYYY